MLHAAFIQCMDGEEILQRGVIQMTTAAMIAVFELVIKYGVDNPTADQIAEYQRQQRKARKSK